VGRRQRVLVRPGTRASGLYGAAAAEAEEDFFCNYGVNPSWVPRLEAAGLRVSAVGEAGEPRIVELPGHPFFVASLFLPQARSSAEAPHPLITGFAAAARSFAEARRPPPLQRGHA
jgi:CTP synthase (UTP-ammonia lyase)